MKAYFREEDQITVADEVPPISVLVIGDKGEEKGPPIPAALKTQR
jgi:hypothetical protein